MIWIDENKFLKFSIEKSFFEKVCDLRDQCVLAA